VRLPDGTRLTFATKLSAVMALTAVTSLIIGLVAYSRVSVISASFDQVASTQFPATLALGEIQRGQGAVMEGLNALLIKNLAASAELRDAALLAQIGLSKVADPSYLFDAPRPLVSRRFPPGARRLAGALQAAP